MVRIFVGNEVNSAKTGFLERLNKKGLSLLDERPPGKIAYKKASSKRRGLCAYHHISTCSHLPEITSAGIGTENKFMG